MTWHIKHEEKVSKAPWAVYQIDGDHEEIAKRFETKGEAEKYIASTLGQKCTSLENKTGSRCEVIDQDPVVEASDESFPASDPPAWTKVTSA